MTERGGDGRLACRQGVVIGLQQGRARSGEPAHFFRDAEIADADLAEHSLHVRGEAIGEVLRQTVGSRPFPLQPMQHGEQVKGQRQKTAFERVGNLKTLVENRKPRLRHNRAIEFRSVRIG